MEALKEGLRRAFGDLWDFLAFGLLWQGVFQATLFGDAMIGALTALGLAVWFALNRRNYRRRIGAIAHR